MTSAAMEEFELMKDGKYRIYMASVDKALKSFENYTDWPDLIQSLNKLKKVIKDNQRFPVIPRRIKIGKRLAQCMHKTLPAGVHLKALEVYDTIFKNMGTNRLSQELFIYSAGLFPLLEHSTISVKSPLLTMYETHFVPLGPRLLPGLSGLLSGVLPGLEEGSDHFERTNALLEKVCEGVGGAAFYGSIWQCVAGNSAVRLPAVAFVLAHINKSLSIEDQQHIMGTNIETMVKALCAGVQDNNALVQRTTLDLLLVAFPLHNAQLVPNDVVRLVSASLSAILRRDMSLNRRLYSWLLGSEIDMTKLPSDHLYLWRLEDNPELPKTSVFFELYARKNLIEGVKTVLLEMRGDIRPYRLLSSLIDRPEIGPVILDDILFEVFRSLYLSCKTADPLASPKRKTEIIKSANAFFTSLESWYIWQYLGSLFDQALKTTSEAPATPGDKTVKSVGEGVPDIWEACELSEFLLGIIPIEASVSSHGEHLMNLLLRLVALLSKHVHLLNSTQLVCCLRVCRALIKKLQPNRSSRTKADAAKEKDAEEMLIVRPATVRSWIGKEKQSGDARPVHSGEKIDNKTKDNQFSQTLRTFIKEFQAFFVSLVGGGRIINSQYIPQAFEKLKRNSSTKNEKYGEVVRKFLTTVMGERDVQMAKLSLEREDLMYLDFDLVVAESDSWSECLDLACDILVEASCFPSPCEVSFAQQSCNLQPWMKTLLVCCCYLDRSPKLQLIAIGALLDLVQLSSQVEDQSSTPLFHGPQILFIQNATNIVKIITEVLWSHLGNLPPHMQVTCTELLHKLLNTFTFDDAVERILGEIILKGSETLRVDSLQKFIKLWTIGRELQDGRQKRCFQPCLLKVMDNMLLNNDSPLRLQTEEWLCQALMRGDIARLLDPLLLILLDPASARLGILHVSIEPSVAAVCPEQPMLDDTSKIYAISSVEGNVIYHVSDGPRKEKGMFPKRLKWRWKSESLNPERVVAVTSLKGSPDSQLRYITEKNISRGIELPRPASGAVSLFVNPFNAREEDDTVSENGSVDEVLKHARRYNPTIGSMGDNSDNKSLRMAASDSPTPSERLSINQAGDHETEDSYSADEFFVSRSDSEDVASRISREILDSVIDAVVRKFDRSLDYSGMGVHPLHSHLLLYCGVFDSTRTLYAFNALRNILSTNPRLFLCSSASSGTVNATYPSDLLVLLARHRKSVYGRNFDGPLSAVNEYIPAFRSSMYLEVLISLCLNYARSYYPNLGYKLSPEVLAGNRLVQLTSIETLTRILTELIPLVRDSGRGFASYIATILSKCKVQKNILHCIMSSLTTIRHQIQLHYVQPASRTFTEEIIDFNDTPERASLTEHSRATQVELLKLVLALIKLEYDVDSFKGDGVEGNSTNTEPSSGSTLAASYSPGYLIPQQPLFFRAVASALSLRGSMRVLHCNWTQLVTSSLPYLGAALPQIVMTVINQLCVNIEELAEIYQNPTSVEDLPPDYALTQLEALTVLCHYCVLDASEQVSSLGLVNAGGVSASTSSTTNTQILTNLVHVFTPLPLMQIVLRRVFSKFGKLRVMSFLQKFPYLNEMLFGSQDDLTKKSQQLDGVRDGVLKRMPRIIASLSALWTAVTTNPPIQEITVWGSPKVVRQQILEFLSPLSVHHGRYFLAAMAVAWHERRDRTSKQVLPVPTVDQQVLVNLLGSIKVLPIDTFVQTILSILNKPPIVEAALQDMSLNVSVLELFYVYMQATNNSQLADCWTSLLALLKDSLLLQPTALFLVLAILNEFVQRSPAFQEKKDQRDLQEITAKLIEGCASVAGACLEQTTWLKRNLAVRDVEGLEKEASTQATVQLQQSVQAQLVLGQILAPLLDVSYGSQEKEKVATLLLSVMYNVTPYLKNHQARYSGSFLACSQLLASVSGYPYTRKAWKKDAFDLLLDPALFQMEEECLPHWTTIVDNLMTHDQTTFNDLMGCIPAAPSGSYNLFSSRDQEYEQRAQMLKRLAFVIMCSDKDQYCKSIISIQDRLSESLRLPHVVPSIQAQVFFCFRVLLLRMSSDHSDALWSLIISEIVQVFNNIEQELAKESEEFSSHIKVMSALDTSWVVNSNNGLNAHGHPHYLLLALAAAKLLDLAVLLPAHMLPQFQMYRWAFVGDNLGSVKQEHEFIPHVRRICKLMDDHYGPCEMYVRAKEGHLLLTETSIESLQQLHPFFCALQSRPKSTTVDIQDLERNILRDFLDKVPTSPAH